MIVVHTFIGLLVYAIATLVVAIIRDGAMK
jgi:capsule polysaccharide export protein KpsE/RkpR